jgi:hypothetical protein
VLGRCGVVRCGAVGCGRAGFVLGRSEGVAGTAPTIDVRDGGEGTRGACE